MNLCSDNHDEVCYDGRRCPACALYSELSSEQQALGFAQNKIEQLEDEVSSLNEEIKELREKSNDN